MSRVNQTSKEIFIEVTTESTEKNYLNNKETLKINYELDAKVTVLGYIVFEIITFKFQNSTDNNIFA